MKKLINKYKFFIIYIFLLIIFWIGLYYNTLLYTLWLVDTINEIKIKVALKIELINLWFFIVVWSLLWILNLLKKVSIKALYTFLLFYLIIYIVWINLLRLYY